MLNGYIWELLNPRKLPEVVPIRLWGIQKKRKEKKKILHIGPRISTRLQGLVLRLNGTIKQFLLSSSQCQNTSTYMDFIRIRGQERMGVLLKESP